VNYAKLQIKLNQLGTLKGTIMNRTFSIIKPDATKRNITGSINKVIEENGLRIIAQKRVKLSIDQAENFYSIHKDRPFFNDLINYMTSEPVVVQVLSGENCIEKYRSIMGATNPDNAENGTIRKLFALNVQENSVHGSDSEENAKIEIDFFFKPNEIIG
jgi:nucleoside-diphosphate kinase